MAVNRGKDFEAQIREDFSKVPNTSVYRLQDTMGGFKGASNICDFIIYHYPLQYFIECKSHYGNTLPFTCVTKNQWQGMLKMSKIKGVKAGVIIWFIDWDKTYFVPIQTLQMLKDRGSKSLNIKTMAVEHPSFSFTEITGKKKRILFSYDMNKFLGDKL